MIAPLEQEDAKRERNDAAGRRLEASDAGSSRSIC